MDSCVNRRSMVWPMERADAASAAHGLIDPMAPRVELRRVPRKIGAWVRDHDQFAI